MIGAMKRLKIFLLTTIILVAGVAAGLWYSYYRVIPRMVSEAIVDETEPVVLPDRYKQKIKRISKPVNRVSEKIIHEIDSLSIPFDAIIRLIDKTDNETVIRTLNELKAQQPENPDEIFDIVKANVPSPEFDLEMLRKPYLKYATMQRYHQGLAYIDNNMIIEQIDEMPYREIVKEVLIYKRAEIDKKLGIRH
jgi:hypothetical protein